MLHTAARTRIRQRIPACDPFPVLQEHRTLVTRFGVALILQRYTMVAPIAGLVLLLAGGMYHRRRMWQHT